MLLNLLLQPFLNFTRSSKEILVLSFKAIVQIFKAPLNSRQIINHLYLDGIKSIPVIFLMSVFTGGVLALLRRRHSAASSACGPQPS